MYWNDKFDSALKPGHFVKTQLVIKDFTTPGFLNMDGDVIFQDGGVQKKALERASLRSSHALDQVHDGYSLFFLGLHRIFHCISHWPSVSFYELCIDAGSRSH